MKISISPTTAGRYGGPLLGNLRYFDKLIQSELEKANFKADFEEFSLILAHPPMYLLVEWVEEEFKKYYDALPYSRLNRKYKTIDITLQAPEFSEHFDKEKQAKYEQKYIYKLETENSYKNISEIDLAKILIDKCLEAGKIIAAKLKKTDIFDIEIFNKTLIALKQQITPELLKTSHKFLSLEESDHKVKRAIAIREKRKQQDLPKDKCIRDLRIYDVGLPDKALYPYDYQYAEIFSNLLIKNCLKCPVYHHLYIQVAKNMDEALKNSFSEDWYVNGLAVIDYENYVKQPSNEKEKIVFNLIVEGLRDIATLDKLDASIIENTIDLIKQKGLDTELTLKTVETPQYKLNIIYTARNHEEECPVFFDLTHKTTNKTNRIQIGKANKMQLYWWLQKVTLTTKHIKVKASTSSEANIWLKDKPRTMEFKIADILK